MAVPSIRRLMSKPSMRTVHFDTATVDQKGVRDPPERYSALVFTEAVGPGSGLAMVSVPCGSFTMGSPADEPERQSNERYALDRRSALRDSQRKAPNLT